MLYELHLTTEPDADVDRWVKLCGGLGVKPLVIELDKGVHDRQIMTASTHEGDDASAAKWQRGLVAALDAGGFPVVREKLEVPLDKAMGYVNAPYHEAHVKMLLDKSEAGRVIDASRASGMHASRNALVPYGPLGWEKWYLTARAYDVPTRTAASIFADAFAEVTAVLPGVRMEMETVLSDSNPGIDKGWVE